MCSRFRPVGPATLTEMCGMIPPTWVYEEDKDVYPVQDAPIMVRQGRDIIPVRATFGMLPHWAKSDALARQTYNARTETVDTKPSFRNAWKKRQFCLVPAQAFYEPCYETGKAVWTRIHRIDDRPIALAGIWETRKEADRDRRSFSMLTIPSAGHPLMQRMHGPDDEKRSVVVVAEADYDRWMDAMDEEEIREMLTLFDAGEFAADAASKA